MTFFNTHVTKYIPFLKFKKKEMILSSYLKMFFGDQHKGHTEMLNMGIDSFTWKLYLSENEK